MPLYDIVSYVIGILTCTILMSLIMVSAFDPITKLFWFPILYLSARHYATEFAKDWKDANEAKKKAWMKPNILKKYREKTA